MKATPLNAGEKPHPRFERIKGDIEFLFSTSLYDVRVTYATSVFYAPDFYHVSVMDKQGNTIWSGGEALFLDTLFLNEFISDRYQQMVLTRVNTTEASDRMQVVLIDLKSGQEQVLNEEGFYHSAGHFISWDGIYIGTSAGVWVIDFQRQESYFLNPMLHKHFPSFRFWSACPVDDCMLILTSGDSDNLQLFNIRSKQVVDRCSLGIGSADSCSFQVTFPHRNDPLIWSVQLSMRQESGALKHMRSEHFKIEF